MSTLRQSRRSLKGVVGLALVNLGLVLMVNSALDVRERNA